MHKALLTTLVALVLGANTAYGQVDLGTSASSTSPQVSGDATTGLFTPSAGAVSTSSGGTEIMRVVSSGVGIGTTAPSSLLHLYTTSLSSPALTLETNASPVANQFGNAVVFKRTAASNWISLVEEPGYSDSVSFALWANPWTRLINIQQNGDLGIGTTSPVASLDVSAKTDAVALPSGTTAQRPGSPVNGEIRYNTSTSGLEAYVNGAWTSVGGSPGSATSSSGRLQCSGSNCSNSTGSGTIQYCSYKGNIKTTASQGNYTIPSGCLTATLTSMYVGGTGSSSVSASTLYYIYLWNTSGTWVLDAETTGHATDSSTGIEIKSGDNTKTLVGMIHTDANKHVMTGGQTSTTGDTNTVATWDNRVPTYTQCDFTADRSLTATGYTEINSENRCNFMSWGDAAIFTSAQNAYSNTAGTNGNLTTEASLDSATNNVFGYVTVTPPGAATNYYMLTLPGGMNIPASEGFHFTILDGAVSGGGSTATYKANHESQVFSIQ